MKNLAPIIFDVFIHLINIPVSNLFPIAVASTLLHRCPPYSGPALTSHVCHSTDTYLVLGHPLPHMHGLIWLGYDTPCQTTPLCHIYLTLPDGFRKGVGSLITF